VVRLKQNTNWITDSSRAQPNPLCRFPDEYAVHVPAAGYVQSLCAPNAPCLIFNDLFLGPLERIAGVCGWERKLVHMIDKTPFLKFVHYGGMCQELGGTHDGGPCIVKPVCPSG